MTKAAKRKIALQMLFVAIAATAIFNMPEIAVRPPAGWVGMLAIACFAFGLCFGIGLSHLFPVPEEEA